MNYNKKTIKDIDVSGKRCLVRVDFNVPLDENGNVTDDNRIVGALPTIKYLIEKGAKVILCSHLGRPKGKVDMKYSLAPAAKRLKELGVDVTLSSDVTGPCSDKLVSEIKCGQVIMLENLRFCPEEEKNDREFSRKLASYADVYVDDAFGTAHRAHASTAGVAEFVKVAVAGLLVARELEIMGGALADPKRPFVAVLGGSKVSDKIGVIENLLNKVDYLLIGGAMAYTFEKALGKNVGNSKLEEDKVELASSLMKKAEEKGVKFMLPIDTVAAKEFSDDSEYKTVEGDIPDGYMGLDIGEKTVKAYADIILKAGTVVWNGPMGVFEMENFAKGTKGVAQAMADSNAVTIVGGGDSAAAVIQMGYKDKMTHISTGGGASLEFLEGKVLPGIACLNDK